MRVSAALLALLLVACAGSPGDGEAPPAPAEAARAMRPENYPGPPATPWQPDTAPAQPGIVARREPCASRDPRRQPFFGDLHVHTAYSMDVPELGVRNTPDDAYRFARGEAVTLPGTTADGSPRRVQLERPLDFAAVTDHAEWIGEVSLCERSDSPVYSSEHCRIFRGEQPPPAGSLGGPMLGIVSATGRPPTLCGADMGLCRSEASSVWQRIGEAAERAYDRSARCSFTTFHAWEYSYSPYMSKVHRNVILRNEIVPELPISWLDEPTPQGLWRRLAQLCNDTGTGCQALAIPHNPNLSNGRSFAITWRDLPLEEQRAQAEQRAAIEPLVEMMQVKGESECQRGLWNVVGAADEFCDFEKIRGLAPSPPDCEAGIGAGAQAGLGCVSRLDYARYALAEGLAEQRRIGVNPYRLGFIGSTDSHNGTPGDTEEYSNSGHDGIQDGTPARRLADERVFAGAKPVGFNPGGLAGVWAEENARDSIFDALLRRETFATSGTRIAPRFFGGWDLPADLCTRGDLVGTGYARGVPMGGTLPARSARAGAPVFAVAALRDSGTAAHPGALLQRAQIIKVWVDDAGLFHEEVHDVAGGANRASVDTETCTPRGSGHDRLCGVWRDPDFDASRPAVYYVRVLENPSCRWHAWDCLGIPAAERPASCSDPAAPWTIQERAWTSPIWYSPARSGS
jgi:hypothetical protein